MLRKVSPSPKPEKGPRAISGAFVEFGQKFNSQFFLIGGLDMAHSLQSPPQSAPASSEAPHDCTKQKDALVRPALDLPGGEAWGLGQDGPRSTVALQAEDMAREPEPLEGLS